MKFPISVCMIVKNEEQNLMHSLAAISPYVEEVVVVDTGSDDRTREIAAAYGAHVSTYTWNDHFAEARNASLKLATKPFIFVLDADEIFDASTVSSLATYLSIHAGRAGMVQIKNVSDTASDSQLFQLPRIFPNTPAFRYVRRIHEQLRLKGEVPETIPTDLLLVHHGYKSEAIHQQKKLHRNLRLLEQEQLDAPHDAFVLFQLAKTYYMGQQYEQAGSFFQKAVDEISRQRVSPAFLPSLFVQYGYTLLHLRRFADLFQVLEVGVELYPDYTHLYFLYGQALIELKDPARFTEIKTVFEHCLRLGDNRAGYESVPGVGSFMAQFNLGVFYEVTGQLDLAREHYQASAVAGYAPANVRLTALR